MGRLGTVEKVLFFLTTLGALLTVVALALFALGGSGFVRDLLRGVACSVLGMMTVLVLTRSPRRGRRIAALLLLASAVGSLVVLLMVIASASAGQGQGGTRFIPSFLGWMMGASLGRLLRPRRKPWALSLSW